MTPSTLEKLNRNAVRMHGIIILSYAIDVVFLLAFSYIGMSSAFIALGYGMATIGLHLVLYLLIRTGANRRFKDPGMAMPQTVFSIIVQITCLMAAPQIGLVFMFNLFTVFAFGVVAYNARQYIFLWSFGAVLALLAIYQIGDRIVFPNFTSQSLLLISAFFVVTIGRAILIIEPIASLRASLVKKNKELSAALKRVEEMATHDSLTEALNRRAMIDVLQIELKRFERSGTFFCVAMIDLDNFKPINDSFGHAIGDEVLRMFSGIMRSSLRLSDRLARYGGDEFVLMLTDTRRDPAMLVLERLCSEIEGYDWARIVPGLAVTASIGVTMVERGDTIDQALERADNALYAAKSEGRNKVRAAGRTAGSNGSAGIVDAH
jgi:diguanylate cyclase (GGDEF)-like protein